MQRQILMLVLLLHIRKEMRLKKKNTRKNIKNDHRNMAMAKLVNIVMEKSQRMICKIDWVVLSLPIFLLRIFSSKPAVAAIANYQQPPPSAPAAAGQPIAGGAAVPDT